MLLKERHQTATGSVSSCSYDVRSDLSRWGGLTEDESETFTLDTIVRRQVAINFAEASKKAEVCGTATGAACDQIYADHKAQWAAIVNAGTGTLMVVEGVLVLGTAIGASGACPATGLSCVAVAAAATYGIDQIGTGVYQLYTGEGQSLLGVQTLQGLGLTQSQAEILYSLTGLGLEAAAAKALLKTPNLLTPAYLDNYVPNRGVIAEYNPINRGPLQNPIAETFRSSTYKEFVTEEPTYLYRVYGGTAGQLGGYWTRGNPTGPVQSIIDSALLPQWGNNATEVVKIKVPTGTKFYEGIAAPQGDLIGGGNQVFFDYRVSSSWIID